ncbi:ankyrin repeat domain-containing protein [Paraburkholderia hayleyella]|uniref:ankyrin repeat domain-containing protein n=1 Tax=Paraburkholderia hayleyella TaxID=2152889 RepID=UPI0012916FAC|nr:ankyrin repeat domain-containing protein [Paraburkholderia hayleyella]
MINPSKGLGLGRNVDLRNSSLSVSDGTKNLLDVPNTQIDWRWSGMHQVQAEGEWRANGIVPLHFSGMDIFNQASAQIVPNALPSQAEITFGMYTPNLERIAMQISTLLNYDEKALEISRSGIASLISARDHAALLGELKRLPCAVINKTDEWGNTLLHLAILKKNPKAAWALVFYGANPKLTNAEGKTPSELWPGSPHSAVAWLQNVTPGVLQEQSSLVLYDVIAGNDAETLARLMDLVDLSKGQFISCSGGARVWHTPLSIAVYYIEKKFKQLLSHELSKIKKILFPLRQLLAKGACPEEDFLRTLLQRNDVPVPIVTEFVFYGCVSGKKDLKKAFEQKLNNPFFPEFYVERYFHANADGRQYLKEDLMEKFLDIDNLCKFDQHVLANFNKLNPADQNLIRQLITEIEQGISASMLARLK